jgi:hypothetical protein
MILRDYLRQAIELVSVIRQYEETLDSVFIPALQMQPMSDQYGANTQGAQRDTEAIITALFPDTRSGMGGFELLMDLHGVYSMFG